MEGLEGIVLRELPCGLRLHDVAQHRNNLLVKLIDVDVASEIIFVCARFGVVHSVCQGSKRREKGGIGV